MSRLQGKKVVLGITGSIAAYKAAALTRLLVKAGVEVQVLMTPAACSFISPLTLSTLSKRLVFTEISEEAAWNNHVELGLWANAMIIAPLTATTMAKLSLGIADNILTAVYLSARCPVFFAPAMDLDMWRHPAVQEHTHRLQRFGNLLIPPGYGELASGLTGEGRMAEPEQIVECLEQYLGKTRDFSGKTVLVTAGPTYEPIDPVRFVGNRSSGHMGVAIADAAAQRGARVILILGPSKLSPTRPEVQTIRVETAQQMYEAALEHFPGADAAILSAAVADYRPAEPAAEKIKKSVQDMTIRMVQNPDIAATLGQRKQPGQITIGFALETADEERNAFDKLQRKNMDCIVLNSLRSPGAGFDVPTNRVTLLFKSNNAVHLELKTKEAVADDILDAAGQLWNH